MKKNIYIIGIVYLFLFCFSCATQIDQDPQIPSSKISNYTDLNPDLYPTVIPKHVCYSSPIESDCSLARELLEKAFQKDRENNIGLFNRRVIICHSLWLELKSEEPYKSDPGGLGFLGVDGVILETKLLKSNNSLNCIEAYLRNRLHSDNPVIIRPPDHEDLIKYWALIGWDIETPLFVAVNNKTKVLFDFDNKDGHPWNIVLLSNIGLNKDTR